MFKKSDRFTRRNFLTLLVASVASHVVFKFGHVATTSNYVVEQINDDFIIVGGWMMLKEDLVS